MEEDENTYNDYIDPDMIIISLHGPLSTKKEDIFKMKNEDPLLKESIGRCKDKLSEEDIEIFEQDHNILIAENGYYVIGWLKDFEVILDDPEAVDAIEELKKIIDKYNE